MLQREKILLSCKMAYNHHRWKISLVLTTNKSLTEEFHVMGKSHVMGKFHVMGKSFIFISGEQSYIIDSLPHILESSFM